MQNWMIILMYKAQFHVVVIGIASRYHRMVAFAAPQVTQEPVLVQGTQQIHVVQQPAQMFQHQRQLLDVLVPMDHGQKVILFGKFIGLIF